MLKWTADSTVPRMTLAAVSETDLCGIDKLSLEARASGHPFLDRLIAEWHSGANRFDKPGECLLGLFDGARPSAGSTAIPMTRAGGPSGGCGMSMSRNAIAAGGSAGSLWPSCSPAPRPWSASACERLVHRKPQRSARVSVSGPSTSPMRRMRILLEAAWHETARGARHRILNVMAASLAKPCSAWTADTHTSLRKRTCDQGLITCHLRVALTIRAGTLCLTLACLGGRLRGHDGN